MARQQKYFLMKCIWVIFVHIRPESRTVLYDLFSETKDFVANLFVALGNDSYITPETRPPKPAPPPPPPAPAQPQIVEPVRETKVKVEPKSEPEPNQRIIKKVSV